MYEGGKPVMWRGSMVPQWKDVCDQQGYGKMNEDQGMIFTFLVHNHQSHIPCAALFSNTAINADLPSDSTTAS